MPSGVNGLFLSVDDDHALIFEKFVKGIDLETFFRSPVRRATQQSWEGEYFFKGHRKVIAVADSTIATTIPIPVELVREAADEEAGIAVPELENMIAQEMAKIFNQCRSEAAARLATDELDTMLVGEKARNFRVDGNLVMNPVGFTGRKISLQLELTFTGRKAFESLKQFFNAPEDFFFAESSQVRLSSLARTRKLPINLVFNDNGVTSLFVLENAKNAYPVLYREPFVWNFDTLFGRIAGELSVSDAAARQLYGLYLRGGLSEYAARSFKKMIDPAIEELLQEVEKRKLKGFLYIDAPFSLPFAMPYRHAGVVFDELPLAEILGELGFGEVQGSTISVHALSRHLLPFLEAYFDKTNMEINQKLRRRLHWLAN